MWSFRSNRLLEPVDVSVVNLVGALGQVAQGFNVIIGGLTRSFSVPIGCSGDSNQTVARHISHPIKRYTIQED